MSDSKIIDFQAKLRARMSPDSEIDKQMDVVFLALAELAETIESIRSLGADDRQVVRILRHAADELEQSTG